ncbi:Uncharacterized protein APZ42_002069, partial [Daphnia magna]
ASQKTSVSNYQYPEKSLSKQTPLYAFLSRHLMAMELRTFVQEHLLPFYFTLLNVDSPPCYLTLNFANFKERAFFKNP